MRCSSCEPLLDAHLESALRPGEARSVAAHLRDCTSCAALLQELRVVDALLATARPPRVPSDITAAVVSATQSAQPQAPRRVPLGSALLIYLFAVWAVAVLMLARRNVSTLTSTSVAHAQRDLAALEAVLHALAPATPVAAAVVCTVLLVDLLLLATVLYGYRRLHPMLAVYLNRGIRR